MTTHIWPSSIDRGHLLIQTPAGDYHFTNLGPVIQFGHAAGPSGELNSAQLRAIAQYCIDQAKRIESNYP